MKILSLLPLFVRFSLFIGLAFTANLAAHNKVVVIPLDNSKEPSCGILGQNVKCDQSGIAKIEVDLHFDCSGYGENGNNFGLVLQTFAVPISFGHQIIQYLPEPQASLGEEYFPQVVARMNWGFGDFGGITADTFVIDMLYLTATSIGNVDLFRLRHDGFRCNDNVFDTQGGPTQQTFTAENGVKWRVTPVITKTLHRVSISEIQFEMVN